MGVDIKIIISVWITVLYELSRMYRAIGDVGDVP